MSGAADDAEWHAKRLKHVGGSEVAALFDCQPEYAMSRYTLWHVKAGNVPPPEVDNPRTQWGLMLEAAIAQATAERDGLTIHRGGHITDQTTPGLGCTLDYIIDAHDYGDAFAGPGALEIKNSDWIQHKRTWTDDEPPMHVLLQLQHQLCCTGYQWGVVACLVGGNDLRTYKYHARPKLIADIRRRVRNFWQSIAEGREPPVDGSAGAGDVLRALYSEPKDEAADMRDSNEWPEAVADLINSAVAKKAAGKAYDLARNRVTALLGDHRRGWGGGYSVSVSITPEKAPREAMPGEMIPGRVETRRLIAKEMTP